MNCTNYQHAVVGRDACRLGIPPRGCLIRLDAPMIRTAVNPKTTWGFPPYKNLGITKVRALS